MTNSPAGSVSCGASETVRLQAARERGEFRIAPQQQLDDQLQALNYPRACSGRSGRQLALPGRTFETCSAATHSPPRRCTAAPPRSGCPFGAPAQKFGAVIHQKQQTAANGSDHGRTVMTRSVSLRRVRRNIVPERYSEGPGTHTQAHTHAHTHTHTHTHTHETVVQTGAAK